MNDPEQIDVKSRPVVTFMRRALLAVAFIFCLWTYGRVFDWLVAAIEGRYSVKLHFDRAPFIRHFLETGIGVVAAWTVAKGLNNLLTKKPFLWKMYWREVVVVAFCFVLFGTLSDELDQLAPGYGEKEWEDRPSLYVLLDIGILLLTVLIGRGLWPRPNRPSDTEEDEEYEARFR